MSKQTKEVNVPGIGYSGNRRKFLKFSGATIASTGLIMSGCHEIFDALPQKGIDIIKDVTTVDLGSGDTGILNYAYVLEQLEAAFYIRVVNNPYSGMSEDTMEVFKDLRNHEVVHRDFLKAALGMDAIMPLTFDFSSVDFSSQDSVGATARTFEDLGVAAYNGAGRLLKSPDLLLIAGKIVSVEARHAAVMRSKFGGNFKAFAGDDVIDENGLDRAFTPAQVLEAASPFILNKIIANQLPTS